MAASRSCPDVITVPRSRSTVISLETAPPAAGSHSLTDGTRKGGQVSPYSTALVFTIDVAPAVITTPATASINEGVKLAIALTATETVTWAKTVDAGSDFEIVGTTLRWAGDGTRALPECSTSTPAEVTATDTAGNKATPRASPSRCWMW